MSESSAGVGDFVAYAAGEGKGAKSSNRKLFYKRLMSSGEFTVTKQEGITYIHVKSERLDAVLAPRLKSEFVVLSGSGINNMVLDLESCKYCDSSGLSAILVGNRLCRNAGGALVLTKLNPGVERLITISQLDTVLNIAYNETQLAHWFH